MGVTIGGDATKIVKNTHLLVVMRTRLSQEIGLIYLRNWTRFKKGNVYKIRTKVCTITGKCVECYIHGIYTTSTQISNSWVCDPFNMCFISTYVDNGTAKVPISSKIGAFFQGLTSTIWNSPSLLIFGTTPPT